MCGGSRQLSMARGGTDHSAQTLECRRTHLQRPSKSSHASPLGTAQAPREKAKTTQHGWLARRPPSHTRGHANRIRQAVEGSKAVATALGTPLRECEASFQRVTHAMLREAVGGCGGELYGAQLWLTSASPHQVRAALHARDGRRKEPTLVGQRQVRVLAGGGASLATPRVAWRRNAPLTAARTAHAARRRRRRPRRRPPSPQAGCPCRI